MKRQYFAFLFILIFATFISVAQNKVKTGSCLSCTTLGNKVIFQCENSISVELALIDTGIIKIWYYQGDYPGQYESFAVVKKENTSVPINLSEQPASYEIFTGDLIVRITKSPFRIHIFDKYQKLLTEDFQDSGFIAGSSGMISYKSLKPEERIYGLGEKSGPLNRTGSRFKMWNSDKPCYQAHEDPLYKSIPFFMSSSGYGIFFDNTYKTEYNFGSETDHYYSFSAPGGEMIYYFIYGPAFPQIISRYTKLTGRPVMPPSWALGFAQCRGWLTNEKLTREIATGYRERKIPCDIIYQDIGWTRYLQDFEWQPENYDDPVKMLCDLEADGFKVIVSQDPVVSQANENQWKEADSLGYFVKDIRTGKSYDMPWPWGGNCGVVDFTNPEVAGWWGKYQQKVLDDGVRGFWTDMGEPAWSNEESTDRLFMKHLLGMHDEIHNVYGLTWDKVVAEQFDRYNPNTRMFQMTRSGFAGMQRYTFGWSGDAGNGNDVAAGWKQLEGQVTLALSAGMCGIPFWSCDISGYCGDIKDYQKMSELYIRWLQFGAFNPLSRIHHEGNNAVEPWLFGSEAEAACKKAIEFKYRLFPYIYSYAREAYDTGMPLMRALLLEYPDDPEVFNLSSEFLFGKELLVAPVIEEGAVSKKIYLPEGEWFDWNGGQSWFRGKQWIDYPVSPETIPVFVKKGAVVPMMPVMQFVNERTDYPLLIHIFPGSVNKEATFGIYEDDGETNDYKQGVFELKKITCRSRQDEYVLNFRQTISNGYNPENRDLIYFLHLDECPSSVLIGSLKMKKVKRNFDEVQKTADFKPGWSWNSEAKVCRIEVPAGKTNNGIILKK